MSPDPLDFDTYEEIEEWTRGDPGEIIGMAPTVSPLLATLLADLADWRRDALCREFDINLWFPMRGQSTQPALDICRRCPVRVECLDDAMTDTDLDHGVRGGLTATARKLHRKAQAS